MSEEIQALLAAHPGKHPDPSAWPQPGPYRRAARDDRSHLAGGPAAHLLDGATWIRYPEATVPPAGERPAYVFVTTFTTEPGQATLHVTAHGVYEAFVNGVRVGDRELTPGFTAYHTTVLVQSYDVSGLVHAGENELRLVLSDGWFRGRHGYGRVPDGFGTETAVIARLETPTGDVVTGTDWRAAPSDIVAADLMDGQRTDKRLLGREEWVPAVASDDLLTTDRTRLDVELAPPVRRTREYPAVSVTRLPSGRQIVDLGVNTNGWVRLTNLGPDGTTTTLTHGEHLDADGDLTMDHLAATDFVTQTPHPTGQVDQVVSRGVPGDVFEPRHTTHGFRYVAVDGRDDDLAPGDVTGVEVRTDLRRTGWFECSNADLTRFHEIAYDTWRANTCDVPTDCPTRERSGFTGDYQIYVHTATYLEDVLEFSRRWLRGVADEQLESGVVTNIAPVGGVGEGPGFSFEGSAGWGDAAAIVPWELYLTYGDPTVLEQSYATMKRWVDWAAWCAREHRHWTKDGAPEGHQRFIWDTGFHWGEWLEPGGGFNPLQDNGIVATAYLAHSSRLVSYAATVLGRIGDREAYGELARLVTEAWRAEYWQGGRLTVESQASYVRGLRFGLFPEADRAVAAARLSQLVSEAGDHLSTGFLATSMLLPVLADAGYADQAYRVLLRDDEPGWLVMLRRGATTVWENWDGVSADGVASASLSHYSKGSVITFLHEYVAGLRRLDVGWKRFLVKPVVGGGVTWAKAAYEAPAGRIEVSWWLDGGVLEADVTVPPGATAVVDLPGAGLTELSAGTHRVRGRV